MKKRAVAVLSCVALGLFFFFVPFVRQQGFDFRCTYCPTFPEGFEASLAYAFLGNNGAVYDTTGYHFILWGTTYSL